MRAEIHESLRSCPLADADKCRYLRSVVDEGITPAKQLIVKVVFYFSLYFDQYLRFPVFIKQQPILRDQAGYRGT